ncbi:MAG: peptide MFS transporter [Barnesiella sp.]|nr:peptide MFS transporter [Barnesiella sp.]MBD5246684.1 peptide MFS transporter [Barnesiella sp.]
MFKNQPKGLYVLALANTGERFGYYTMLAILLLFLQAKFALPTATAGTIYSVFLALVYFMPMIGGIIADKWNFQKTVTLGIVVMFLGYLVMAIPMSKGAGSAFSSPAFYVMILALLLISCGTGLFKGNLQVMVGDLYNNPKYEAKRDVAFSLFYMAINIGAMFAPSVTESLCSLALSANDLVYNAEIPGICNQIIAGEVVKPEDMSILTSFSGIAEAGPALTEWCQTYVDSISTGYSYAFAVACFSMVLSFVIYKLGRKTYQGVSDSKAKGTKAAASNEPELTKEQTKSRIVALLLVFTVVIFFWMVFHQNGLTLTKFAQEFTSPDAGGFTRIGFNVWALALIVVVVYAAFNLFQSKSNKVRGISAAALIAALAGIFCIYSNTPDPVTGIQPQIYQQFNPFYVVALTPFSVAIFSWLAKKKKEPSAPRKIGYGMLVAGLGFAVMAIGSIGLGTVASSASANVTPNLLIGTYLILTFAELLLSPMGISFVSKVAPPKYKGMMMGCWFGATAIGNLLTAIPALLWGKIDVAMIWVILVILCVVSALFIFAMMKKLEAATSDTPAPAAADALETVEDDAI